MMLPVLLSSSLFLFLITSERAFALPQLDVASGKSTISSTTSSGSAPLTSFDGTASTSATPLPPSSAASSATVGPPLLFIPTQSPTALVSTTSNPTPTSTYLAGTTSTPTSAPSLPQSMTPVQRRNLILILTLGLGSVLIAVLVWLSCKLWRRRNTGVSFFGRNAPPIDDEEIQTWRKQASITSAAGSHIAERRSSFNMEWVEKLPMTPTAAKAPNARMGLTDETVPGEKPFVPLPKRSTSGLHRPKHLRSKSARSSISDRPPTPYAVDESRTTIPPQPRMPEIPCKESQPGNH